MKLPKDLLSDTYRKPNVFLCETDKTLICGLETIDMRASLKFNAYSELTFTVPRTYINMTTGETKVNPHYDKIQALRLIYLEGFGYFEIQDPELISDGLREVKNITAYGLEYTLAQKYLENLKINTGEIDSLEVVEAGENGVIVPITLYDEVSPNLSLLNIVLEKAYGWKIGHVDNTLKTMGRTFEISRVSIYDFIVQEICDKFNCFAVFNTIDKTINLYAEELITKHIGDGENIYFANTYEIIGSVTIDGYRTTEYELKNGYIIFDTPPTNGAKIVITDGSQQNWETDVYISFDNLAQEVNVSYSADNIKTVLTVKGSDNLDIREVNMGLPYLVDLSYYYTPEWMGQDLYDSYTRYLKECDDDKDEYQQNAQDMVIINGKKSYEENRLSLQYSEASVISTTVGTYYVRGGFEEPYYYTEVSLPDEWVSGVKYYTLSGADLNKDKFDKFYSAIKVYFSSKENKDTTELSSIEDDFSFMKTNTIANLVSLLKNATTTEVKKSAILSFLDELWDQLGLTPLKTRYQEPYKQVKEANEEEGWHNTSNSNYWNYYPVTIVLESLDKEIKDRENTIAAYKDEYDSKNNRNNEITNNALIYNKKYFTEEQLVRLSAFLREDEYTDDNFVETDADSIETIMKTKRELLECGKIELSKLCEPKLEFSMDMANIYALPEFEPIIDHFQLGYLINVVIRDDYIKRARLLEVDINFDDFSDFTCSFGELTSLKTQSSIHADLLASAITAGKSVASNASYWNQSSDSATSLALQIHQGLLDAATVIKAIDGNQGVSIDKYGIHLREYDPITGELNPKEGWIVNNRFLYSDDNFKTAKSVFGEYMIDGQSKWGLLAEAVMAGYIAGCDIEGGTIKIGEYYDDGQKKYRFEVDSAGHVTMNAASISGYVTDGAMSSAFESESDKIKLEVSNSLTDKVRYYGTCYADAEDSDKSVVFNYAFTPTEGTMITVKFINENKADNPMLWVGDGPNAIHGVPIYAYGNVLSTDSKYNWAANSLVTFVYSASGEPTDSSGFQYRWEIADGNSEKIYSKIEQTQNNILLEVGASYVTNDTLSSYSTTKEMKSAIELSASGITSTVSENYATKGQVTHYGTCSTASDVTTKIVVCSGFELYKGASISVRFSHTNSAKGAQLNVNNTGAKNIAADDWNIMAANSAYNWDDNSTVIFTYDGSYWRISDSGALKRTSTLSSEIKQAADKISLIVKENDVGTEFEVNSEAVRMAWNNSNKYIKFADGEINMYRSESTHNISTLFAKYNNQGAWYYHNGYTVGKIGTNHWDEDASYRGLVFDLSYDASYMCWAHKDNASDDFYTAKLIYHANSSKYPEGLHFECKTYADGRLYLTDTYRIIKYNDDSIGYAGELNFVNSSNTVAIRVNGENKLFEFMNGSSLQIYNDVVVDCYSNIDMHYFDIIDADMVTSSDARLKTNIQDTTIDALSVINQIEMKEFDWIESGKHENIGMIAQQLQTIAPDLVTEDSLTGKLSIKTNKFIPYLIKAIQQLSKNEKENVSAYTRTSTAKPVKWIDTYDMSTKKDFIKNLQSNKIIPSNTEKVEVVYEPTIIFDNR